MIGTIRKHSKWLWWAIASATIISFIWWNANPVSRNGNGSGGGYGTVYGNTITAEDFQSAKKDFYLYYLQNYKQFPDHNTSITPKDIEREAYMRLLLSAKARQMGIHISEE